MTVQVIEPVLDSSRYFVMRIEKDRKKAYIGIGFQERSEALDFKIALQEYKKYLDEPEYEDDSEEQDYSLQEGETLHVDVAIKNKKVFLGWIALSLRDTTNARSKTPSRSMRTARWLLLQSLAVEPLFAAHVDRRRARASRRKAAVEDEDMMASAPAAAAPAAPAMAAAPAAAPASTDFEWDRVRIV